MSYLPQSIKDVYQQKKAEIKQRPASTYWLTRFMFLRGMGFVYLWAFISAIPQVVPLFGARGLEPLVLFMPLVQSDNILFDFIARPTLFHFFSSDASLLVVSWIGAIIALAVVLGYANSIMMFLLWILYMSLVNVGQNFYSFGWEHQTLELGLLCIFLVPLLDARPFPSRQPPIVIIWLLRFFLFRFYLGAGLIKLRGSECWDDFTCLFYHFQTQPIPNPLSRVMHFMPDVVLKFGVMFTEFLQVIAAFFVFFPRSLRIAAGVIFFTFQSILILTGNYSFFNWVTLVPGLALFDDRLLKKVLPKRLAMKAEQAERDKQPFQPFQHNMNYAIFGILLWLSLPVLDNLASEHQVMNKSYTNWSLVNTYGAFGYVGTTRPELVVLGTQDEIITPDTQWQEYEFIAKPTSIDRGLPIIAPYQPRLDWQIWFAAQSSYQSHPWMINFLWKILNDDQHALSLIEDSPFDGPPTFIKVDRYLYEFEPLFSENVWRRQYMDSWIGAVDVNNPTLHSFIKTRNWHGYGKW